MNQESFLSAQLRESAPYLADAGFRETAQLMRAAAVEIDLLRALLRETMPDLEIERYRANENRATQVRPDLRGTRLHAGTVRKSG